MNKNQLIEKIKKILDRLATTSANIQQEPYKSDLFDIFEEAAIQGFDLDLGVNNMHADQVLDDLIQAGLSSDDSNLVKVHSMWHEWSYCQGKRSHSSRGHGHANISGGSGLVTAYQVSINDDGKYAHPSEGYPQSLQISLSGLIVLNKGPINLVAPQKPFPLNAPKKNIYLINNVLFGV